MSEVMRFGWSGNGPSKLKPFIATPTFGELKAAFSSSIINASLLLREKEIPFIGEIYSGNCHVDDSRNLLVRDFLETDCTDLIFIDADIAFNEKDLLKLIEHDVDVVAGVYPLKNGYECYPVAHLAGEIKEDEKGMIEVSHAPTGFMRIKRNVIEKLAAMANRFPSQGDYKGQMMIPLIFERLFIDNKRMGGDVAFCWKWRNEGGKIHIIPDMKFLHYGEYSWGGNYSVFLSKDRKDGFKKEIEAIKNGTDTQTDLMKLREAWGNDIFCASIEYLYTAICMARESKGDIIECGSGLSSICMAAASKNTVYSLEHDIQWVNIMKQNAEKLGIDNLKVIYSPLKDYGDYDWYTLSEELPDKFGMLACDGPPRKTRGRRKGIIELAGRINENSFFIYDDYEEANIQEINKVFEMDAHIIDSQRRFLVGTIKKR